jgi:hypothetical protein
MAPASEDVDVPAVSMGAVALFHAELMAQESAVAFNVPYEKWGMPAKELKVLA